MVKPGDTRHGEEFRGHVLSVQLGHDEILRGQFGLAWWFVHEINLGSNYIIPIRLILVN
jgi:hypothetical protein